MGSEQRQIRCGLLAKKLGMTRLFEEGMHVPVTILELDACVVVSRVEMSKRGYTALQLGSGMAKSRRVNASQRGLFARAGVGLKRILKEFRVSESCMLSEGDELMADHFAVGQKIDVQARSIGKGFAGAMKRHNFGGLRASHGVSISHRSHGSTGGRQDPGKVFKGKKMAGHMGARTVSVQNLVVVRTDVTRGLIFVRGAVPGPKGGYVTVRDACKEALYKSAPLPASVRARSGRGESVSVDMATSPAEGAVLKADTNSQES